MLIKIDKMNAADRNDIKTMYGTYESELSLMLDNLLTIVIKSREPLEGNSFYNPETLALYPELYTKQLNLFWCGRHAETSICEIGFNAGHSSMLMLLGSSKPNLKYTIFDIGEHAYTRPCLKYIQQRFDHVNFEYIEGDSTITMPVWIAENKDYLGTYDVVHVDGGHTEHCIANDLKNADMLVKIDGILIIDDTNISHINQHTDLLLTSGRYRELDVMKTQVFTHRIVQKVA